MPGRNDDTRLGLTNPASPSAQIACLNDALRRYGINGRLVVTAGVIALGEQALAEVLALVAAYNQFTADNDPYGERNFGAFNFAGEQLFWKIDYFSLNLQRGSPDPPDAAVTTRVLTIMLTSEY